MAEFDDLVERIDVIPDTDFSDLRDEVFVPMVEMLRTLAHLVPSLTEDQVEIARNAAIRSVEAVRTGAHQKCLGVAQDGIRPCKVALRGQRAKLLGRCGAHASEHLVFRALDILGNRDYARTDDAKACFHCIMEIPGEDVAAQCFVCGRLCHAECVRSEVEDERIDVDLEQELGYLCTDCAGQSPLDVQVLRVLLEELADAPILLLGVHPECYHLGVEQSFRENDGLAAYAGRGFKCRVLPRSRSGSRSSRSRVTSALGRRPSSVLTDPEQWQRDSSGGRRGGEEHDLGDEAEEIRERQLVRLQEQVDQLLAQSHGTSLPLPVLLNHGAVADGMVSGVLDGWKSGTGPSSLGYLTQVDYLGVLETGPHRAVNMRVIGASRIDLATQGRFIPGSVRTSQLLETGGGGQIVLGGAALGYPSRHVFVRRCETVAGECDLIARCGREPFVRGVGDGDLHIFVLQLVVLRFRYMVALLDYLSVERTQTWETVWCYLCFLAEEHFARTPLSALPSSRLDCDLWDCAVGGTVPSVDRLRAVAQTHLRMDWLLDAQRRAGGGSVPVPVPVPGATPHGGAAPGQAVVRPGRPPAGQSRATVSDDRGSQPCPLCGSRTHTYSLRRGYTHEGPITVPCTQPGSDGQPCGLLHAFRGPLRTPCRS